MIKEDKWEKKCFRTRKDEFFLFYDNKKSLFNILFNLLFGVCKPIQAKRKRKSPLISCLQFQIKCGSRSYLCTKINAAAKLLHDISAHG